MTRKFPVLTTVLLLASGFARAEPVNAATPLHGVATVVGAGAGAATAMHPTQLPTMRSQPVAPAARTRAEVQVEAVDTVRNHRSTFARDLDFLKN